MNQIVKASKNVFEIIRNRKTMHQHKTLSLCPLPPTLSLQALVSTNTPGLGYMDLLRMLTGPVYSQSAALPHKQAYCSIAKCVAALTRACPNEGPAVVGQFIQVSPGAVGVESMAATCQRPFLTTSTTTFTFHLTGC